MDPTVLDDFAWRIDLPQLMRQLGLQEAGPYAAQAEAMAAQAEAAGRPKALYRESRIESRGEDHVVIEGRTFLSRVLAVNLEKSHKVFPFVATCGAELDAWSRSFTSTLDKFWADCIKGMALGASVFALVERIRERHHPGDLSMMNPGSIESWSLSEQRTLFSLLGNPQASIGVELLQSCFMKPAMSASGMWFPAEHHYENCMLCQMENCPGRRAPYDGGLLDRRYKKR
jgi:hypothetical protein